MNGVKLWLWSCLFAPVDSYDRLRDRLCSPILQVLGSVLRLS